MKFERTKLSLIAAATFAFVACSDQENIARARIEYIGATGSL